MEEYGKILLLTASLAVLYNLLLPARDEKMKKMLEFALSLVVLLVLCRPLVGLGDVGTWFDAVTYPGGGYDGGTDETLAAMEEGVAAGIVQDLSSRYRLAPGAVVADVTLKIEENELIISRLCLTFSKDGLLLDHHAVRTYAEEAYQTECEVYTHGR